MTLETPSTRIPWYRDVKSLAVAAQVVFLLLVIAVIVILTLNVQRGLREKGLNSDFGFLNQPATYQVSEGTAFGSEYVAGSDSNLKAILVGLNNTLRVAGIGIVLATLLGLIVGISRLSSNWLVSRTALFYVELLRNTPLLVQIVIWYFAVILQLPDVKKAIEFGGTYLSSRGINMPWLVQKPDSSPFWPVTLIAVIAGVAVFWWFARQRSQTGKPNPAGWFGLGAFAVIALGGFLVLGQPLELEFPRRTNFGLRGGAELTPEYAALLIALVIYTSAFIAEIVRAGIQAVAKGQWEASRALGLSATETLQLIILPQALRVIIPPLGNQYLNLTKNSSLGVAIGFPDLFNVLNTAGNQTGYNLQTVLLALGTYLVLSLSISALVNWYNRATRLVTR